MIVQSPEIHTGGLVNQAMASLVDLMPTILDWTSAKPPRYRLPGKSLRSIFNAPDDPSRNVIYCLSHVSRDYHVLSDEVIRTRRYKYILNLHPELEFPFATDLFVSRTWQGILKRKLAMIGKRSTRGYLYRPPEELYDLEKDPAESVNLAGNPDFDVILKELRAKLGAMRAETDDYWLINDNYRLNRETFQESRASD